MDMMAYQYNDKISSKETHFLKTKLVLTWLLEFRVSNVDVLSKGFVDALVKSSILI